MRLRALLTCLLVAGCRKGALEARADDAASADDTRAAETTTAVPSVGMAPLPPMTSASASPSLATSASGLLASPCAPVPTGIESGPKVDLDGDGQLDAITKVKWGLWGVFLVRGTCGVEIGQLPGANSIVVNRGSTNGMRDLVTNHATLHNGFDENHTLWKWNGTRYVERGTWMTRANARDYD
jgi:hypothetical protein